MHSKQVNLDSVAIPQGLDDKQSERARIYVKATVLEGLTVKETCDKYGISSGTLYNERHLKNPVFNRYVQALTHECIGRDDFADHQFIANKIKENAMKSSASQKDYDLYIKAWGWMFEYMKHQKLKEMGVSTDGDHKTPAERKARLLKRLKS